MRGFKPAMRVVTPPPVMRLQANHVRIRFVGLPAGGKIFVNGQELKSPSIDLARGTVQLPFRAEAKGYVSITGMIPSDRDHEVKLPFRPLPKVDAMDAGVMGKDPKGMDPMGMDAMGMKPAMRWGFIRGRHGTNVKTNYDDSD
jgi:hypothetical protein